MRVANVSAGLPCWARGAGLGSLPGDISAALMPRSIPEVLGSSSFAPEPFWDWCCLCAGLPFGAGRPGSPMAAGLAPLTAVIAALMALLRCWSAAALLEGFCPGGPGSWTGTALPTCPRISSSGSLKSMHVSCASAPPMAAVSTLDFGTDCPVFCAAPAVFSC